MTLNAKPVGTFTAFYVTYFPRGYSKDTVSISVVSSQYYEDYYEYKMRKVEYGAVGGY